MGVMLPVKYRLDEIKRLMKSEPKPEDLRAYYDWALELNKHTQGVMNHAKNALFKSVLEKNGSH